MRVLLIQPRPERRVGYRAGFRALATVEPLALESIAGALRPEHEVRILDQYRDGDLSRALSELTPHACGISCSFTVDVPKWRRLAELLKSDSCRPFVFVGGHHASLTPEDFAGSAVDVIVAGEGELASAELLAAVEGGTSLESVPGLILNTPEGQTSTGTREFVRDLDTLPYPDRGLTSTWRRLYHLGYRQPLASVETARGCPYHCNFCSVWRFYRGRVRQKSPERVIEEIARVEFRKRIRSRATRPPFRCSASRA